MAVVTLAEWRARFPEFSAASDTLCQACIDEAHTRVSVKVWSPVQRIAGIKYLAAHLVATNPSGEFARLDEAEGSTQYSQEFDRLKRTVAAGFRII